MPIVVEIHYPYKKVLTRIDYTKRMTEYAAKFDHSSPLFRGENFNDWKRGETSHATRIQHLVDPTDGDTITIEEGIARIRAVGYEPNGVCEIAAFAHDAEELWNAGVLEIIAGAEYCWRKIEPQIVANSARVPIVPSLILRPQDRGLHLHDKKTHIKTEYDTKREIKVGHYFAAYPHKNHPHLHEI
jgi:hypothetical protein